MKEAEFDKEFSEIFPIFVDYISNSPDAEPTNSESFTKLQQLGMTYTKKIQKLPIIANYFFHFQDGIVTCPLQCEALL